MANNTLSDEDKALFRDAMRSVTPLRANKTIPRSPTTTPHIPSCVKTVAIPPPHQTRYPLSSEYYAPVDAHSILSYGAKRLAKKHWNAFKHGNIPCEAQLDLHGLRPDAACNALCAFIDHSHQQGLRCLRVIHGKGSQDNQPPVLKNLVYRWLPQIPKILAFHSALPRDGGTGALYVLLKSA